MQLLDCGGIQTNKRFVCYAFHHILGDLDARAFRAEDKSTLLACFFAAVRNTELTHSLTHSVFVM